VPADLEDCDSLAGGGQPGGDLPDAGVQQGKPALSNHERARELEREAAALRAGALSRDDDALEEGGLGAEWRRRRRESYTYMRSISALIAESDAHTEGNAAQERRRRKSVGVMQARSAAMWESSKASREERQSELEQQAGSGTLPWQLEYTQRRQRQAAAAFDEMEKARSSEAQKQSEMQDSLYVAQKAREAREARQAAAAEAARALEEEVRLRQHAREQDAKMRQLVEAAVADEAGRGVGVGAMQHSERPSNELAGKPSARAADAPRPQPRPQASARFRASVPKPPGKPKAAEAFTPAMIQPNRLASEPSPSAAPLGRTVAWAGCSGSSCVDETRHAEGASGPPAGPADRPAAGAAPPQAGSPRGGASKGSGADTLAEANGLLPIGKLGYKSVAVQESWKVGLRDADRRFLDNVREPAVHSEPAPPSEAPAAAAAAPRRPLNARRASANAITNVWAALENLATKVNDGSEMIVATGKGAARRRSTSFTL